MSKLSDWVGVSHDEKPFVHFESSLDNAKVVSGYVPVKSTLEVFEFLKQATELTTPQPRAVICHGAYGSGKSRLCTVIARLFRDGFDAPELQPVWERLRARSEGHYIDDLRQAMAPGGSTWRPWLVVPMYEQAGGGTIASALIRALVLALRRAGLDDSLLGKTIFHAAARRLEQMIGSGAVYSAPEGSPYTTPQQLRRALEEDLDEEALTVFRDFHRASTHGVEFKDFLQSTREAALEAHEVYEAVAKNIRQHHFDGIVVIWDEFGFAVEELLRDEQRGVRSLGQEVMRLQTFLESACGSHDVAKRVVFLGFTHVSLPEYGTRANLGDMEQNRLNTVSDRFRNPSINIRLSITETEGYHLLAGMIQRTDAGKAVLESHPPRLVALSGRMPQYNLWSRFSTDDCCKDIVAPCYPLQPAAATSLLLLSDQIAQINRTSFYYLQSIQDGGFAGELGRREAPQYEDVGSSELVRVDDMFSFFKQPISERRKHLYEQYEDAEARFPDASEFDLAVLRTVLILSVVANRDMAPTTAFLSFCLCDAGRDEPAAAHLHEALTRLSVAGCLWKNESTDIWGFGAGRGIAGDIERSIDEEKALIPSLPPGELLSRNRVCQDELADYLGEINLDPADSGVIRRVGVRLLSGSVDERGLEPVNPVLTNAESSWRTALVCLVASDTAEQLEKSKATIASLQKPNYYFVLPHQPGAIGSDIRDLIAVHTLLGKQTPGTHAYEVLESRLTRLRQKLRRQFEESFGTTGLRAGTSILRAGPTPTRIDIASWNDLLPAVSRDLTGQFTQEIRVRCGTFNEWQTKLTSAKIGEIVNRILNFADNPPWHDQYLGFAEKSQEAAIIDGVLVENSFLKQHPISQKWELLQIDKDVSCEGLKEVFHHFTTGGGAEKDFEKLFEKLIDAPFGVPNGIIPILVSLVLRGEMERVAVYERKGSQSSRVEESGIVDAIVRMARYPARFQSRYTRLSGPQRVVYKVIGPHAGVPFHERNSTGEAFYQYCEQVRTELKKWASALPDGILQFTGLTENQRKLLRMLRAVVPPHIVPLADALVEFVKEDANATEEIRSSESKDCPALQKLWLEFCTKLNRHVEGMKAPVRMRLRELVSAKPGVTAVDAGEVATALEFTESLTASGDNPLRQVYQRVKDAPQEADVTDIVASAISGKPVTSLTDEDYGRAEGVLRMAPLVKHDAGSYVLLTPNGERHSLPAIENAAAAEALAEDLVKSLRAFGLTRDELLSLAVRAVMNLPHASVAPKPAEVPASEPATKAEPTALAPSTGG